MIGRRPIILGIVGDSAAGKTTLTRGLVNLLGPERVTHVCSDDYHKYDRRERTQLNITALHPDCNYLDIMELQLERLHYGQPILMPVYDHSNGSLVRPQYVQPCEFVIVEGLLGYHSAVMRQFYDVKVYLDPPEDLRRVWKIQRDTAKRGYHAAQVLEELEKREPDSRDFIRPQRAFADIVVEFHPPRDVAPQEADGHLNVRLILRPTISHPDLSYLFDAAHSPAPGIQLELGRDCGRPVDILEIEGDVVSERAGKLEEAIWRRLPDLRPLGADQSGAYQDRTETRRSEPLALTQQLLAYHLLGAFGGDSGMVFAPPVAALSRLSSSPDTVAGSAKKRGETPHD